MDIIIRTKAWSASIFLILALALVMAACSDSDSGEDATVRPTAAVTPTESSLPPDHTRPHRYFRAFVNPYPHCRTDVCPGHA